MTSENLLQEITGDKTFFTINAYEKIATNEKSNFILSPFSVETVLSLTRLGARAETAEEIRIALAHHPCDPEKIESTMKKVISSMTQNRYYTLKIANKIYVKENFQIKEEFKKTATDFFMADIENIEFTEASEAAKLMNQWVETRTEKKIRDLVAPKDLTKWTRLIIINALYFKALWMKPFKRDLTTEKDFHKSGEEVVKVKTMRSTSYYNYYEYEELNAKFLELSLIDEASMVIVLPNERNGLEAVENKINLAFTTPEFTREYVSVDLPQFRIESKLDFKDILQKSGVVKAFDENEADFGGISGEKGDLHVKSIIHKTFIEVGEDGIEAAAATSVELCVPRCAFVSTGPPKEFIVDHPFIFYVKVKGLILFAGRILDPSIS